MLQILVSIQYKVITGAVLPIMILIPFYLKIPDAAITQTLWRNTIDLLNLWKKNYNKNIDLIALSIYQIPILALVSILSIFGSIRTPLDNSFNEQLQFVTRHI